MPGLTTYALERGAINYSLTGVAPFGTASGQNGQSYALLPYAGRGILANWLGLQIDITGAPTAVSVQIQGSLDGVNYYPIGSPYAATTGGIYFIDQIVVLYIYAQLVTLTGGTSPTVKASFTQ